MLALAAGHMIAALILLNLPLTVRARLCVGLDPLNVLAVAFLLCQPICEQLAAGRLVSFLGAVDTVGLATLAHYVIDVGIGRNLS